MWVKAKADASAAGLSLRAWVDRRLLAEEPVEDGVVAAVTDWAAEAAIREQDAAGQWTARPLCACQRGPVTWEQDGVTGCPACWTERFALKR